MYDIMIPAIYYHLVYLLFISIISVVVFAGYPWGSALKSIRSNKNIVVMNYILVAILIIFIGYRDPNSIIFGDTAAYSLFYSWHFGEIFEFSWDVNNPLFDNFYRYMSCNIQDVSWFYLIIAFIYFGGILFCCRKIFPNDTIAALIVCLAAFSTFSYATNGIKAGAASSLFLVALAVNDKNPRSFIIIALFMLLSIGFHHSMKVVVVAFIICKIIKKPQFFTSLWIICFFLSVFHVTYFQELFAGLGNDLDDEKIYTYLSGESIQKSRIGLSGFRIDFIIYSVVPIIAGWIGIYAKKIKSEQYIFLLNLYTLVNAIWMTCMYVNFTNRIAYLSWQIYPIVLIYPFLREDWGENRYVVFKYIAYGHLAFTLFMYFIYYA